MVNLFSLLKIHKKKLIAMIKIAWTDKIKEKLTEEQFNSVESIKEDEKNLFVTYRKPGNDSKGVTYDFSKNYFRVVTNEKEDRAEMFLYGFIGQDFWWGDDDLKEETITDLEFIRSLRELESKFERIDIRINSPGGSVFHGDPIITAIRNSPAEIHTYIDGLAASMGFDIWVAAPNRHMSINSKAMCHSTMSIEFGTAADMRSAADRLDVFDNAAINTFAAATDMSKEEIKERFYDYKDHWLTAEDVKGLGLIAEIEDYKVEEAVVDEKASLAEIIKSFTIINEIEKEETETIEEKNISDLDGKTNKELKKIEEPEEVKEEIKEEKREYPSVKARERHLKLLD